METALERNGDGAGLGQGQKSKMKEAHHESMTHIEKECREQDWSGSPLKVPEGARFLIVCDDNSDTDRLKSFCARQGSFEWAKSITEGCEAAKSGRFQVVVSSPRMRDGS